MTRNVAIVTGGSSGIGLATTHRLLDEGWRVAAFAAGGVLLFLFLRRQRSAMESSKPAPSQAAPPDPALEKLVEVCRSDCTRLRGVFLSMIRIPHNGRRLRNLNLNWPHKCIGQNVFRK